MIVKTIHLHEPHYVLSADGLKALDPKYRLQSGAVIDEDQFRKLQALMPIVCWLVIHTPADDEDG